MNLPRPAVAEERWLALAARHPALREAVEGRGGAGGWKQVTPLTRTLLFVLGAVLASLLGSIVMLLGLPWPGLLAGILQLVAAEYLIRRRRMFGCGVDEALFLFGAGAITFELIGNVLYASDAWPWIIALAAFAAGLRLLNRWMVAIAAIAATAGVFTALGAGWDAGVALPVTVFACACALAALAACRRTYQRPAHDAMVGAALVAFAIGTCAWGAVAHEMLHDDPTRPYGWFVTWVPLALVVSLGAACIVSGFRWRVHAPLWAGLVCVASLLAELLRDLPWAWEWRVIVAGSGVLLFAIAAERGLRRSRGGVTSRQVVADDSLLDLIQLGGAATMAAGATPRADHYEGGGGRFGGGGASGNF